MNVYEQIPGLLAIAVIFILIGNAIKKGLTYLKSQRSCHPKSKKRIKAELIGEFGEKQVRYYLGDLPREDYEIFNDILIRDRNFTTQIDHVIISRFGIFVVETKNFHGKIYGSENSEFWKQYLPDIGYKRYGFTQEHKLMNPIWQNETHIKSLQRLFGKSVPIHGIVVFPPEAELYITTKYPVLYMWDLAKYILQFKQEILSSQQVEEFKKRLIKCISSNIEDREYHLENVARSKIKRAETLRAGKCPRCGGNLILRNGKYGQFYGCANYPECKYKSNS